MIEYGKVIKSKIKEIGDAVSAWLNKLLNSIKKLFDRVKMKFKEKVIAGISLKLKKKDGKYVRENHLFFETKEGYSKTVVTSEEPDVIDQYKFLNEGGTIDITEDFANMLELEH